MPHRFRIRACRSLPAALALAAVLCAAPHAAPPSYRVANRFPLPGDEHWDLLAADASGRLFVTHGNQVQVLDEKNGKLLGAIPDMKGAHGVALATEAGKGYASNGKDTSLTVFDLKTLAVVGKIKPTGPNPDGMLYDAFSKRVFAFNGKGADVSVVDPGSDKIIATVALGGKPELAVSDGKGMIYVNLEDKGAVAAVDAKTLKVKATWSLAPGEGPTGLAIDVARGRLFSACDNKLLIVLDAATGKVLGTAPIAPGADGAACDPAAHRVFVPSSEGSLAVIGEIGGKYQTLATVATQKGARTIAFDEKSSHAFLPTAEFGPAPAAPTPDNPKARPPIKPGTFVVIDVATSD